jgi:hypothetical protein
MGVSIEKGNPVPAISVISLNGELLSLDIVAKSMHEMYLVAPSCDRCTTYLQAWVAALEAEPKIAKRKLAKVLLVVLRDGKIARSNFMTAFEQLREAGVKVVTILPVDFSKFGMMELPARITLNAPGMMILSDDRWIHKYVKPASY